MYTTRDQLDTLEAYAGVRKEWCKCPNDWIALSYEHDRATIIDTIIEECLLGEWGNVDK